MLRLATALVFFALAAPAQALDSGNLFDAARLPALAQATTVPDGFTESVALSGLTAPTTVRFSPAGKVVVAEKSGVIKEFDSLSDPTPTVIADLSGEVHDFWDRGLLGLALDPGFDTNGKLYALYTYNKAPGNATVPRWPSTSCPAPPTGQPPDDDHPGATLNGCVVSGRLSMIDGSGEHPLIEDWCQQYPSHSVGSLVWGADGKLYVSAGEGANFNSADYGQFGNPCGDPSNEGGALRSQDIRTSGDTLGLDGTILRLDPAHPAQREIVAYGLRNPFRITTRPGTNEVWIGDVGWNTSEEIDRLQTPDAAGPVNFGWPCVEGPNAQPAYATLGLSLCQSLTGATGPYWDYAHWVHVDPTDTCPTGGSSISGLAFYPAGGSFGDAYQGALFFADYTRNCIWVMKKGTDGLPDVATRKVFVTDAAGPVDLQVGPDGDLFYVDMNGGTIRRIRGSASVQNPTARATADKTGGPVPLTVNFDGSGSSDPRNETLTYAWDFGDGSSSTQVSPTHTYQQSGVYPARLVVTDTGGNSDTTTLSIKAGTPPTVTLTTPAAGTTWAVGDTIHVAGSALDALGDPIPDASLGWHINLRHCNRTSGSCHTHPLETFTGSGGSFVAPDHEYPSYLEVQLTATDSVGLATTVTRALYPKTVAITLRSQPAGIGLTLGADTLAAPFTLPVIQGSRLSVTAPTRWTLGGTPYTFSSWSDGRARTHEIVAGTSPATYVTRFAAPPKLTVAPSSLTFSAIAGSSSPAPKKLTVTGPSISVTGRASWLSVARVGSAVTVSAETAGLARGTFRSTVEVRSPGLPPVDVPVKLTVKPRTTGLVGAWGFDEARGRTARDASRPRNPGRISGATRTNGRHAGALSFDGIDDRVTVARARSLDLKRMTLEAWVRPRRGAGRRAVLVKGPAGQPAYGLYGGRRPSAHVFTTADAALRGPALRRNAWSHLAFTWDGAIARLYVNGRQVAQAPLSGAAVKSAGPLRIGGAAVPGEWFRGRIDDVRVYNRALSAAEIAVDRHTPVG
jgi:glucose/arabinose dehydrogenase/PKD repeat protein